MNESCRKAAVCGGNAPGAEALYVHIPFCDHICSYCDFPKLRSYEPLEESYLEALRKELCLIPPQRLRTIYIGGGTPSALSEDRLGRLLMFLSQRYPVSEEFSFEANPESLTPAKARILARCGVTRVSIGVQAVSPSLLAVMERHHDASAATAAVSYLREAGISNINLDFIYGLKAETADDIRACLDFAFGLHVSHISYYSLQLEKGTKLGLTPELADDDDTLADKYAYIRSALESRGYRRYEVSNFALPGFESRHNLTYWHAEPYYAAGLGAVSYVDHIRARRTRNIFKYIRGDELIVESHREKPAEEEFDYLMLNLRLEDGFALSDFSSRFGKDFLMAYGKELSGLKDYFSIGDGRVRVRPEHLFILDSLLVDLLHFGPDRHKGN